MHEKNQVQEASKALNYWLADSYSAPSWEENSVDAGSCLSPVRPLTPMLTRCLINESHVLRLTTAPASMS